MEGHLRAKDLLVPVVLADNPGGSGRLTADLKHYYYSGAWEPFRLKHDWLWPMQGSEFKSR